MTYPLDGYGIAVSVIGSAPANVVIPPLAGAPRGGRDLRLDITYWSLGESLTGWQVSQNSLRNTNLSAAEPGPTIANIDEQYTVFYLERSQANVVFVLVIAATPFLLVLAYLVARFVSGGPKDTATNPLELSAALLAVITLRQVLIPAEVSGFTFLDRILGFEVVALVAITIFAHAIVRPIRSGRRASDGVIEGEVTLKSGPHAPSPDEGISRR